MREQFWIVPSSDPQLPLRATLFRPLDDAEPGEKAPSTRRPLVIINHGTDDGSRLSVSMPVYYWLSRWFVERGYAVLLPQRRGHGATGGPLAEAIGTCQKPDHYRSGLVAAQDIAAVMRFMKGQPFVDADDVLVAGVSTGGWASLAVAALEPEAVRGVINFAGGRGGHAYGVENAVCGEDDLVAAAGEYGRTARAPTIWFYAENDSYFGPKLAESLASAWSGRGGLVEAQILPAYGVDGHSIADDRASWDLWGPALDRFLATLGGEKQLVTDGVNTSAIDQTQMAMPVVTPANASLENHE